MSVDYSELTDLLRQMEDGRTQLDGQLAGKQIRAMRALLGIARSVAHVVSGDLRDSLYIIQPSIVGDFIESSIAARMSYALHEADKGGEHDYPALTIEAGQAIINELTDDAADLLMAALGVGRG